MEMKGRNSCVAVEGFEVLHDGLKSYWKTRSNLDILICSHNKFLCIEIIAYNAETGIEAPRLYLSSALLATKLNMDDLQNNLVKKKESLIRQKKSFTHPEISKLVYNEMMVNFILTRLNISSGVDLKTALKMVLTPMVSDETNEDTNDLDIICPVPFGLKPVVTTYQRNFSPEEIILAQYKLKTEQINLMEATRLAELLISSSDAIKVMLDEQRRRSEALKAMSKYRLLWINAIDKVLRQNFIEKVRARLLNSSIADWYRKMIEPDARTKARIEAAKMKHHKDNNKTHKKQLRRSLDNSELLPGLKPKATDRDRATPQLFPSQGTTKLPDINNPPRGVHRVRKNAIRRTFDSSEHKVGLMNNDPIALPHIPYDPDAAPPSIAQSFIDVVSRPLASHMLQLSVVNNVDTIYHNHHTSAASATGGTVKSPLIEKKKDKKINGRTRRSRM